MLTRIGSLQNNTLRIPPLQFSLSEVSDSDSFEDTQAATYFSSVQLRSVAHSCPTLCDLMDCSTPGLPVHHQLPEFTQTHVH